MTVLTSEENIQEHISIEGLRSIYSSCFTCGVSWQEDHISLDCEECGGYAMTRPCPECNGRCSSKWTRNLSASHENQKAKWEGCCSSSEMTSPSQSSSSTLSSSAMTVNSQSSCCSFQSPSSQDPHASSNSSASAFHKSTRRIMPSKILTVS